MRGWTIERIDLLTTLWADGLSCSQIARELDCGLTRNAVIGKVTRLGLPRRTAGAANRVETPKRPRKERPQGRTVRRKARRAEQPEDVIDRVDIGSLHAYETAPPLDGFLGIPLLDLKPNQCRYPRGEGAATLFCGKPSLPDSSYCTSCHRRCHAGPRTLNISEAERERRRVQGYLNSLRRNAA